MIALELNFTSPKNYSQRNLANNRLALIISIIVGGFVALGNGWIFGLLVFLIFFLVQHWKLTRNDKFFIEQIVVDETKISIHFDKKGKPSIVQGEKKDFRFKKGIAFNKARDLYLAVHYRNELIIKQYLIGSWTEKDFDQLLGIV